MRARLSSNAVRAARALLAAGAVALAGGCAPTPERPAAEMAAAPAPAPVPAPPAITSGMGLAPTAALAPLLPLDQLPPADDEGGALSRVAPVVWDGPAVPAAPAERGVGEEIARGAASWYGAGFHNRLTASGERFDAMGFTAAHRTLPFGTRLCVRSLVNGRTVVVRVTDRGPFTGSRIIDLSRGAAETLGMVGLGIKQVALSRAGRGGECVDMAPEPGAPAHAERATRGSGTRLASTRRGKSSSSPKPPNQKQKRSPWSKGK